MVKIALLKATENELREFEVEEDKVFDFITQNSDKSNPLTSIDVFGDLKGIDVFVCDDFLNDYYLLNCATATKDVLLFGDVWFVKRNPKDVDLKESLTEEDFSFIKFCFRKAQKIKEISNIDVIELLGDKIFNFDELIELNSELVFQALN